MPSTIPPRAETREQKLERARREARFIHARNRVTRIVAADPPLTDEQRRELARILTPGGDAA